MCKDSLRLAGVVFLMFGLTPAWAGGKAAPNQQDAASSLAVRLAEGQAETVSEWEDAQFEAVLVNADGTTLDVTDSPNLSWSASCGGSFDGGTFTPLAVNQSLACDITATFSVEDEEAVSDTITVNIRVDHCRNGRACGTSCGCTPGSAFGLITGLGLVALWLLPRPRRGRRA